MIHSNLPFLIYNEFTNNYLQSECINNGCINNIISDYLKHLLKIEIVVFNMNFKGAIPMTAFMAARL